MKIYFNRKPISGPWGGGNKTVTSLAERMKSQGHEVCFELIDNIDIIFCFDPRPNNAGEWYQTFIEYRNQNPDCKIIQRVGDIGTHGKPELTNLVLQSTQLSDFLVFPSDWARKAIKFNKKNYDIIPNSPLKVFYSNRKLNEITDNNIKIVTHHWSTNELKGFELYKKLRDKISQKTTSKENFNYEFTYIGRAPKDLNAEGITIIDPLEAEPLSKEISNHHIYLTASLVEAGANHVLEAMAAGLPIVYHSQGGSIPEYCAGYGIEYSEFDGMLTALSHIVTNYKYFRKKVTKFDRIIDDTVDDYIDIINAIHTKR